MRHADRWDLPKGHSEAGESLRRTALREMSEETGIAPSDVELDGGFECQLEYPVDYGDGAGPRQKRVHYYLGWIDRVCEIRCTEHEAGEWFDWAPPHRIQAQTIDPVLESVERYLAGVEAQ